MRLSALTSQRQSYRDAAKKRRVELETRTACVPGGAAGPYIASLRPGVSSIDDVSNASFSEEMLRIAGCSRGFAQEFLSKDTIDQRGTQPLV